MALFDYLLINSGEVMGYFVEHIQLTLMAIGLAILIGVPIGIFICYVKQLKKAVLGLANLVQAIPSIALLGFLIPLLGIGRVPTVVVVTVYSLLPIIKNTVTGISNISDETLEAARGIGMTRFQILYKVEIPLAMPVIMAGVRISAVTSVGLMTMGGLIGGGGLGYLIYSGIRSLNNSQILAGAIPACILALFMDYVCGIMETLLVAPSLQEMPIKKSKRIFNKVVLGVTALLVIITFVFGGSKGPKTDNYITVGSKDYTENILLSELVSQVIESNTDIEVLRELNLGGSQVVYGGLLNGDIDMYVEYTGSAYTNIFKHSPISDVDEVYNTMVKDFKEQNNVAVYPQMTFNNTYTLAVKPETAEKYGLKTFSDISKHADEIRIGSSLEFLNREDGLVGLQREYGYTFTNATSIDGSSKYLAIDSGEVEMIDAFSTDGLLKRYNLIILEDDKNFFPPYHAAPVARQETYDKYPEIVPLIDELGKLLDNDTMSQLNYEVDVLGKSVEEVSKNFLSENGILK